MKINGKPLGFRLGYKLFGLEVENHPQRPFSISIEALMILGKFWHRAVTHFHGLLAEYFMYSWCCGDVSSNVL